MSTTPPTRAARSRAVYRRRRLAALVVAGLALALVAWLVVPVLSGADQAAETPSAAQSPTPTATGPLSPADLAPTGSPDPSASESPASASAPSTTAAPGRCQAPQVVVTAVLDAEHYAADQQPQLSLTLANRGASACIMDVGTLAQSYVITSGTDQIWSSADCQTDARSAVARLEAGQELSSPPITWVRERSSKDTCGGERPAAVAGGATYQLTVSVDGITSEPRAFTLD